MRGLDSHSNQCANLRGSVLIIVLWIALGLVSVALMFGQSMIFEYKASANRLAENQAGQAIEGAVRYVTYLMTQEDNVGKMPDLELYEAEQAFVGEAMFWFLGRNDALMDGFSPAFELVDEGGRLNLNTATQEMLELLPGMTAEVAAAIVDWRDEDDEMTEGGAESQYYLLLDPGYECKNAPFETIGELRLVAGVDEWMLQGDDTNRNGFLDSNENDGELTLPLDDADGILTPGLLEYLTIYTREPNTQSDGSERLYVNEQGSSELGDLLEETFGEDRAREIQNRLGTSQGNLDSLMDFYLRSGMSLEEFSLIEDALTASEEDFVPGLVNINSASEAVLKCIPGIGEDNAGSVVAYRQSNAGNLTSIAWLSEVLDAENARQAGPYITSRTYQIRADIVAVGRHGKGYRRDCLVMDSSGGTPIVLHRQDLGHLGWALGQELQQELIWNREERF